MSDKFKTYSNIAKEVKTSRWTVKRTIYTFINNQNIEEKRRSERPKGPSDNHIEKSVLKEIENKCTLSVHDIAKKVGTSPSNVQNIKKETILKHIKIKTFQSKLRNKTKQLLQEQVDFISSR